MRVYFFEGINIILVGWFVGFLLINLVLKGESGEIKWERRKDR